jgi:UDP-N-acetylglucosamine 2-epimerase
VEAGLRSFNRRMPEELNRVATDHLAEILFAPTGTAMENLRTEGLQDRALLTGDVMYDAVLFYAQLANARSQIRSGLKLTAGEYGVVTVHRAENTTPGELATLLQAINTAAERFGRIIFPMHPRTASILKSGLPQWQPGPNLTVIDPLSYLDMLALMQGASWVLTDSGGLQKEAFFLDCPCVTLRNETEWVETLQNHANCIAGSDGARLVQELSILAGRRPRAFDRAPAGSDGPFGNGHAAERIAEAICGLDE